MIKKPGKRLLRGGLAAVAGAALLSGSLAFAAPSAQAQTDYCDPGTYIRADTNTSAIAYGQGYPGHMLAAYDMDGGQTISQITVCHGYQSSPEWIYNKDLKTGVSGWSWYWLLN